MIGQSGGHGRCAWFPFATMCGPLRESETHSTVRSHKIVNGILQGDVALQEICFLRMG